MLSQPDDHTTGRWDRRAIRAGGSVALVFAVPFSVAARLVAGDSTPDGGRAALAALLSFGAAVGFLLGAGVAAWHQSRRTPLSHGIVTAGVTYLIPQAVLIVIKLARGGDVRWSGVVFNLTVALAMGVFGGFLGAYLQDRGMRPTSRRV
ncbi:MAG: hypothetical protein ACO3MH_07245 [Ilumatobacteraceae bacterium]|jgi:hypothetical protein|nr:hypothetical protein [Actinomycetota bacterium]MDA3011629.1 hypothetical protein [Actinomycetota bacterium]MDA3024679.1 hypothetical protein [Actinomycetota bacterium]